MKDHITIRERLADMLVGFLLASKKAGAKGQDPMVKILVVLFRPKIVAGHSFAALRGSSRFGFPTETVQRKSL